MLACVRASSCAVVCVCEVTPSVIPVFCFLEMMFLTSGFDVCGWSRKERFFLPPLIGQSFLEGVIILMVKVN